MKHAKNTNSSIVVNECQVCGSDQLESVLFLGYIPPVNTMRTIGERPCEEKSYPAETLICKQCELVQLGLTVDPQILFPPEYPYTSGTTKILRDNFAELCEESSNVLNLQENDLVVDIGSNDGTLLYPFQQAGYQVFGVEPTQAGKLARDRDIPTLEAFFGAEAVDHVLKEKGPAQVVTAANVFAHMEDVHSIVKNIVRLLDDNGVFISESHYLGSLIETKQYDTVYHEHLRYYSIKSLQYLLSQHNLEIIHIKAIPTHGGSIRVYACEQGKRDVMPSVSEMMGKEENIGVGLKRMKEFQKEVLLTKLQLQSLLYEIRKKDQKVYGIGAPSRASTMVNYIGLDEQTIDCVMEIKGSHKIGKYMPGTLIPVLEESKLYEDQPEYALLFSWHIAEELMPKLKAKGFKGKFIIPLPEPIVVD